jgi:DNA-directed RNA polymerase subunit RPC12/RpoP
MNKEKILQLCDEIENALSDAWNSGAIEYELAGHIVSFAKKITAEVTTIEPEVRRGRWIDKGEYAVCTECGGRSGTQYDGVEPIALMTQFCPHCGAKMDGGADNANQ